MKKPLSVLIVSFYFPPNSLVGSRRWAKFSKYLVRNNCDVQVISVTSESVKSPWDKDVVDIKVDRIKSKYPKILDTTPIGIRQKIKYRMSLFFLKLFYNGSVYDRSIMITKKLKNRVYEKLNTGEFDVLIANGPPHRVGYCISKLKPIFKDVLFAYDFRDPWTWWQNLGYNKLSKSRMDHEKKMEAETIKYFDLLFVPNMEMRQSLINMYKIHQEKVFLLSHGFDEEDFSEITKLKDWHNRRLNVLYFGTVYTSCEDYWRKFIALVSNKNLQLDVYTSDYFKEFNNETNLNLKLYNSLPVDELFKAAKEYDVILLIYPEEFKDYFATKFFEMIQIRRPIFYIGHEGATQQYIVSNQLGVFLNANDLNEDCINDKLVELSKLNYNYDHDISEYSCRLITKKMLNLITNKIPNLDDDL